MAEDADLGDVLERYVTDLVESGRYSSRSEILREGMKLFKEREARLAQLDAALARGIADADAGRVTPIDEAFDEIRPELRSKAEAKAMAKAR